MSNTVVILTEEFMKRISVGLGEVQAKFAIPVLNELQAWTDLHEKDPAKLIALVDDHLKSFRDKVAADIAKTEDAVKSAVVTPVEHAIQNVEAFVEKVL
jgi:hypothetical protein